MACQLLKLFLVGSICTLNSLKANEFDEDDAQLNGDSYHRKRRDTDDENIEEKRFMGFTPWPTISDEEFERLGLREQAEQEQLRINEIDRIEREEEEEEEGKEEGEEMEEEEDEVVEEEEETVKMIMLGKRPTYSIEFGVLTVSFN
uniref:Uncharacterized protein n=1 Tax=Cacopsylla melanoneura TaxID=428564 RepID=A0A8D8VYH3_9HEMI